MGCYCKVIKSSLIPKLHQDFPDPLFILLELNAALLHSVALNTTQKLTSFTVIILIWFISYATDRQQFVSSASCRSDLSRL